MPERIDSGSGVVLASLSLNVLSLALPIVILQVYDRVLPNQAVDTFTLLIIGLVGVLLIEGFVRTARAYITGWDAARLEHVAGCRAIDRMLAADIAEFEKSPPGVHLDRLYAIDQVREFHAGQARLIMIDLPFIGVFLAVIWIIGGPLVLIPIGLLAALGGIGLWLGRRLRESVRRRAELDDRRYSFIIEVLSRIQTVKLLAMEPLLLRRYERLQEHGALGTYRTTRLSTLTQSLGALFSNLVMISVAAAGAAMVIADQLSIGGLAAATLLAGRSVQPLLRGLGIWTQVQGVAVAKAQIAELFALPAESRGTEEDWEELTGAIELKDVTFGYEGADPMFTGLDLRIAPGEVIGISGETGGGKSSLLMLLMGLLRPSAGRILYDGIDVLERDPYGLRRQIAFLPQSPALFRGSILDNLTMFQDAERVDEALDAAKLIGLHDKVRRLPAGYGTEIGDGAPEQLASGMRQMIAVARALAGRRRIILFDEANSAFDSETDAHLKRALASLKGKTTMVLVSHRPSLLALSDRIYDIENGTLVERPQAAAPAVSGPRPEAVQAPAPADRRSAS